MKTTDFTGTYDYEREVAQSEAAYFNEVILPECDNAERVAKEIGRYAVHWKTALCAQGYADFREEWNKLLPEHNLPE